MSDIIQQARDYVDSRGTTHQPRAYELARALVEMADAEPKQERPNKGDPMLDAVLKVRSAEFDAWVKSLPSVYWARYDLSACRIGWEAGRVAMQQAEPPTITTHDSDVAFIGGGASYDLTAEPVATVTVRMKADGSTHKVATMHVGVDLPPGAKLYASPVPRITAAQVAELKRLADEYAQMKQAHGAFCNAESRKFLDESRAAFHAALDALVKS